MSKRKIPLNMTRLRFREQFDQNIYEIFLLEEFILGDKITGDKAGATRRIRELQRQNQIIDEAYYRTLHRAEPERYQILLHVQASQ